MGITNQHPNKVVTHYIIAKLRVKNYARSSDIGAGLCAEKYAMIVSKQEEKISYWYKADCGSYCSKDKNGIHYRTEEDEVRFGWFPNFYRF